MKLSEIKMAEQKAVSTGKNDMPGKCFRNATAPTVPNSTVIGYGTVSDGDETAAHAFFVDDNGDIHEPTKMKGQKDFKKGAPLDHLDYTILGTIKKGELPSDGADGMQQWKSREIALAKLANDAANAQK